MTLHYEDQGLRLFHGSNKDILPTFPDASFDSIVTDPPYELGFKGKTWDSSGIAYDVELWAECLRVLNPELTEWMMGWPVGWVTATVIGLSRAEQLKACGNGVVTMQAVFALRQMLARPGVPVIEWGLAA